MADFQAPALAQLYGARSFAADLSHWVHVVPSPKRVRVVFGDETVADSKRVLLLREARCLPVYYFPPADVRADLLLPSTYTTRCRFKGEAQYWSAKAGAKVAADAAWSYADPAPECAEIRDYFAFEWPKMGAWYEEDEEVFVHARDPYKRIDILHSSRHVQVIVAGESVTATQRPVLLFETGHPVRYYISREDVRMDLLEASATVTRCPYKGIASYWSVRVGNKLMKDLVWGYLNPIPESAKIKGLVCFFNERVDAIYVDGEAMPVPLTKWSREPEP